MSSSRHLAQLSFRNNWLKDGIINHGGRSKLTSVILLGNTSRSSTTWNHIKLSINCLPEEGRHVYGFPTKERSIHIDQISRLTRQTSLLQFCDNKTTLPTHNLSDNSNLSAAEYEEIVEQSLNSLTDYFDEVLERSPLPDFDVSCSDGVLTVKLGPFGTYVINKQTPNKQIWLSSPTSGPKRYDYINNTWVYKHDGQEMYDLLNREIRKITGDSTVDFEKNCLHGKPNS